MKNNLQQLNVTVHNYFYRGTTSNDRFIINRLTGKIILNMEELNTMRINCQKWGYLVSINTEGQQS